MNIAQVQEIVDGFLDWYNTVTAHQFDFPPSVW